MTHSFRTGVVALDFDDARSTALKQGMEFFGVPADDIDIQLKTAVKSYGGMWSCSLVVTYDEG